MKSLYGFLILVLFVMISCHQNQKMILLNDNQISKLDSLQQTYKFSDEDYDKRGLIPSPKHLSDRMDILTNQCLSDLIVTKGNEIGEKELIQILDKGLSRFSKFDYDTEEREFIADIFSQIAGIVEIDFTETLNKWLYGRLGNMIGKIIENKESTLLDTIVINCNGCQDSLVKGILSYGDEIPAYWSIVKCNNCSDLNVFSGIRNTKETRFINCTWIRSYPTDEYDSDSIQTVIRALKKKL